MLTGHRRRPDDTTKVRSSTGSISSGPPGISDMPTRRASVSRPSSSTGSSYGWIGRSTESDVRLQDFGAAKRQIRGVVERPRVRPVMRAAAFLLPLIAKSRRVRRALTRRHLRARSRRHASPVPAAAASALPDLPNRHQARRCEATLATFAALPPPGGAAAPAFRSHRRARRGERLLECALQRDPIKGDVGIGLLERLARRLVQRLTPDLHWRRPRPPYSSRVTVRPFRRDSNRR